MRSTFTTASILALAYTLQNAALVVAVVAFVVAGTSLIIVNRRLTDFASSIDEQGSRLEVLEGQIQSADPSVRS